MPTSEPPARRPRRTTLALLAALAAAGCGPQTYPVEGKVVWEDNDAPAAELAGGMVVFESAAGPGSPGARAEIRPDATFRMTTFRPDDGIPAGRYKVLVTNPPPDEPDKPLPKLVAARFGSADTSGLEASVEPKANTVVLKVGRGPQKKR